MLYDVADDNTTDLHLHVHIDRQLPRIGRLHVGVETTERRTRDREHELAVHERDRRTRDVANGDPVDHTDGALVRVHHRGVRCGIQHDAHESRRRRRGRRRLGHATGQDGRLESGRYEHFLTAADHADDAVGGLDVGAAQRVDGHQERGAAHGRGRGGRAHLVLRVRRQRARDDVPAAADRLLHRHEEIARARCLQRRDADLADGLELDDRAIEEREHRVRTFAGADDVALLHEVAVPTHREAAAVVTDRDDTVEDLERARRTERLRRKEQCDRAGHDQREHRDQAEQQQRARGTTLRETDRHWRESMAVSFVRAVSDEEIQASDRLYADGVIGAEDRTYRPPVV